MYRPYIHTGIEDAEFLSGVTVFHAGTKYEDGVYYTNGGRVLGLTGTGKDLKEALAKAYDAVSKVSFKDMHYRTDIGKK